jgi:hypothetical protein
MGNLSSAGQGRLFFESQDALSARDTNGKVQDVYEWEPQGIGSCGRPGGCVSLISSGHGANDSMFLDSTPNGSDAFFITRSQLLPRDKDDQLDLYDARAPHVPGEALGFPEEPKPPCEGEACKGPGTEAGAEQSAGSASFKASEEPPPAPRPCKKGFVKRHGNCVKHHKARKRHGRRAANHDRRAHK